MRLGLPRSVRARLWTALALLSCAVIGTSLVTWITLQRVDTRLEAFHQQSLSQVAQAIDLSKRSSDLATSAPYLLHQRSNFLIMQQGAELIGILERVRQDWPDEAYGTASETADLIDLTLQMEAGISDLIDTSVALDALQSQLRRQIAQLGDLREDVTLRLEADETEALDQLIWWRLQSMNADILSAAYADNLISVGEEQRHFRRQERVLDRTEMSPAQIAFLASLQQLVDPADGIFELRRQELALNLAAQNALFRIRHNANLVNELATDFARRTEVFLANERDASSATLRLTRAFVASISFVSLGLALASAIFVSRYVAHNITRVSEAMVRLAKGDKSSVLPRRLGGNDEIEDLFRSFRSFRANVLRLDRSNRLLDQRNALFEKVFFNISDGIAIADAQGVIRAQNPAFARILNLGDAGPIPGVFVDWLRTGRFGHAAKAAGIAVSQRGSVEVAADDGQIVEFRASRLPDEGRVWLACDVTERRSMTDRLEQIDRIETLGKMAGDSAHDFANILSTIRTHAHLLGSGAQGAKGQHVTAIENAVDYGTSLTERLLSFARKQYLSPETVELNALVTGLLDLAEIGLKDGVQLSFIGTDSPLSVHVDPGHLESALLNIILNANNAIVGEGQIEIVLTQPQDGAAQIAISDTGVGMSAHTRRRAIEPFFTTRAQDGGTGLGLSIVYGFINQTGGELEIESDVGRGTRVTITLHLKPETFTEPPGGPLRSALIVDDDAHALSAACTAFAQNRFEITSCQTAAEARQHLGARSFDLVISDYDLGSGERGHSILAVAARLHPSALLLLMSGKGRPSDDRPSNIAFLEKPFNAQDIAREIQSD